MSTNAVPITTQPPHSQQPTDLLGLAMFLRYECGLGYSGPATLTARQANDLRDGLVILCAKLRD